MNSDLNVWDNNLRNEQLFEHLGQENFLLLLLIYEGARYIIYALRQGNQYMAVLSICVR